MKKTKQPLTSTPPPQYPENGDDRIQRRKFFAIVGGASAATVLLGGCMGAPPRPSYLNRRLPAAGQRTITLSDGAKLTYTIWLNLEDTRVDNWVRSREEDLLVHCEKILSTRFDGAFLSSDQGPAKAAADMKKRLERLYVEQVHESPSHLSVRLEIIELVR